MLSTAKLGATSTSLANYDFTISYIYVRMNTDADTLSRFSWPQYVVSINFDLTLSTEEVKTVCHGVRVSSDQIEAYCNNLKIIPPFVDDNLMLVMNVEKCYSKDIRDKSIRRCHIQRNDPHQSKHLIRINAGSHRHGVFIGNLLRKEFF